MAGYNASAVHSTATATAKYAVTIKKDMSPATLAREIAAILRRDISSPPWPGSTWPHLNGVLSERFVFTNSVMPCWLTSFTMRALRNEL